MTSTTPAGRILVIEDNPTVLDMLGTCLREEGYGVLGAGTSDDGLKLAILSRPELVLLDIALPGMGCLDCGTELTRPSTKREPQSDDNTMLPMELQVGDRLATEAGEWEVIAPPYTTAGGRIVHARVQRINEPASWEIRSWDAFKRISVKRVTAEKDKR